MFQHHLFEPIFYSESMDVVSQALACLESLFREVVRLDLNGCIPSLDQASPAQASLLRVIREGSQRLVWQGVLSHRFSQSEDWLGLANTSGNSDYNRWFLVSAD